MAVATARVAAVHKGAAARRSGAATRVKVRRRARPQVMKIVRGLVCIMALAFLFGYVSVYANLTTTSHSRSKLVSLCRQERIENERLKVELVRRSGPTDIVGAAQKAGMVYATEYDYLPAPQAVASARKDR